MKMVRRRVRTPAVPKTVAAEAEVVVSGSGIAAFTNEQLLEDQYFASPKRKDCKIEDNCNEVGANATVGYEQDELEELEQYNEDSNASSTSSTSAASSSSSSSTTRSKSSSPTKIKSEKGYGRTIGVPLATRSQTRTIENFFKANAAKTNRNSPNSIIIDDGQNEILLSNKLIQQPTLSASLATPAQINAHHGSSSSSYIQQLGATQQSLVTRHCLNNVIVPKEFIFDLSEDTTNDSEQTELSEDIVPAAAAAAIPLPIQTANDIINDCDDADGDDEFEEQLLQQEQYEQQILLNGFANGFDFSLHRSSQRSDSHSSSHSSSNTSATTATDNIFLQEPVLHLNVDKSPNQASSIKINKTLEVEPKFSSPTSLTASVLHGRFNQIVSLNVSPSKRDSLGYEKNSHALAINELNGHDYALMMPDTDSSSCDSGVAFTSNTNTTNASSSSSSASSSSMENAMHAVSPAVTAHLTRRRKPATPHRILCPSPIKAAVPGSPSPRKMSSSLSPRKSQRHLTPTAQAAASAGGIGVSNLCKSRRRLNASPPQKQHDLPLHNKLAHEQQQQQQQQQIKQEHNVAIGDDDAAIVVLDDDDDDDLNDEEQQCENMLATATANPNIALNLNAPPKSILNSCKHPSNQQNTTRLAAPTGTKAKTQPKSKYTVHRAHQQSFKHQQQPLPLAATNGNREINDFFPIRRSVRKTKTAVKEEMMRNLEQAILEERCEGLKVCNFDGKGRGVVAERRFERGEFVIEYVGDLISTTEAAEREKGYALDENAGCYMYYFKHKNQQYCIDATVDTGKLGRLVNHSRNGNLMTKVVVVKQRPHLVLIAKDDVEAGEELCYDYGDRSKESLLHHPWLAF